MITIIMVVHNQYWRATKIIDCPWLHCLLPYMQNIQYIVRLQLPTCVILPDAQIWLSLSITIPLRSCLCIDTPPTSMAYFSTRRKPGVVLRVPATSPCQPPVAVIARNWEQRVAIPEARARQLRAGLSPRRRHLAGPLTTAVNVTSSRPLEESYTGSLV